MTPEEFKDLPEVIREALAFVLKNDPDLDIKDLEIESIKHIVMNDDSDETSDNSTDSEKPKSKLDLDFDDDLAEYLHGAYCAEMCPELDDEEQIDRQSVLVASAEADATDFEAQSLEIKDELDAQFDNDEWPIYGMLDFYANAAIGYAKEGVDDKRFEIIREHILTESRVEKLLQLFDLGICDMDKDIERLKDLTHLSEKTIKKAYEMYLKDKEED